MSKFRLTICRTDKKQEPLARSFVFICDHLGFGAYGSRDAQIKDKVQSILFEQNICKADLETKKYEIAIEELKEHVQASWVKLDFAA